MDTLSQLFAILAALYAVECVRWTPRSTLVLRALRVRDFRRARLSPLFGSPRAGLIWTQPLPPLGTVLHTEAWPVALGPDAIATREPLELDLAHRAPFEPRALAWAEVDGVSSSDTELHLNGRAFARCGSSKAARALAELVAELSSAPRDQRAALIDAALDRALDRAELRARVEAWTARTRGLRILCNAQFVWIGVVTPAAMLSIGTDATWLVLLPIGFALHTAINLGLRRAFSELLPDCVDERARATLACLLSPISAVRALDELARPLVAEHHPLAAAALVSASEQREIERNVAVDARHPRQVDAPDELASKTDAWFRQRTVEAALRSGVDLMASLAPPDPDDAHVLGYCPRCLRQFSDARALCFDCTCSIAPFSGRASASEPTR